MAQRLPGAATLAEKWSSILDHADMPAIVDSEGRPDGVRRDATAILLENTHQMLCEAPANSLGDGNALSTTGGNGLAGFDPILISLVRRAMPNLIAYDICGVQPMSGPVGLVFCQRTKYVGGATGRQGSNPEAFFNEPNVAYSGATGSNGLTMGGAFSYANDADPLAGTNIGGTYHNGTTGYGNAGGYSREILETQGDAAGVPFREMTFTIDKTSVTAKSRALKAGWTHELAQDLKAIHGLEAETELTNILVTEINAEINREIIRDCYRGAKLGCQQRDLSWVGNTSADFGATAGGVYDIVADSDGRWSAERWRGLSYQIEREANVIGKETRRGKGNWIITTADVASALAMGGFLQLTPNTNSNLEVDDNGNLFAGTIGNGKIKVFIDPFSGPGVSSGAKDFILVGYKGSSPWDAGMFYCPYVPLQMFRAQDMNTFQPTIAFKTRYGMVNNPFVSALSDGTFDANRADPKNSAAIRANMYMRLWRVVNVHGNTAF